MKLALNGGGSDRLPYRRVPADRRLTIAICVAGLVGGVVIVLSASIVADSSAFPLMVGVAAVFASAILVLVATHRRAHDAFSPLGLICLFNVATFALGAVYFYLVPWPGALQPYLATDIAPAVGLGAIGLVALVVGYSINCLGFLARRLPPLSLDSSIGRPAAVIASLLVLGWLSRAYEVGTHRYFYSDTAAASSSGASWLLGTLATLPLVATAYCGARYYFAKRAGATYHVARLLYYVLLMVELAYNAPRGSRAAILTVLMMIIVLRYYGLRRLPSISGLLLIVAVTIFVVFPLLFAYRTSTTAGGYQQDLQANLVGASQALVHSSATAIATSGFEATFRRFAGVTSMAAVLHYGPDALGRKPGETLSWSLTAFLPRALAPNKPDPGHFGNEFAQEFAISAPGSTTTSVTVPQVTELYLNYRLTGIILGMFFIGAVYRLLSQYMSARSTDAVALGVYAALAWPLINSQEAIVAGGVLGIIKVIGVLSVVMLVVTRLQIVATQDGSNV